MSRLIERPIATTQSGSQRGRARTRAVLAFAIAAAPCFAGLAGLSAGTAQAGQQLASEMGCYNCHGSPTVGHAPTFARLSARYEASRGDAAAQKKIAEALREASVLHPINAHERLSPESAERLIRWISDGRP